jgi:hypothetical protein
MHRHWAHGLSNNNIYYYVAPAAKLLGFATKAAPRLETKHPSVVPIRRVVLMNL